MVRWFEVRLYESFRVPQDSARAEVSQGSTKLCKDSTRVPQGSTMLQQGCVVRKLWGSPEKRPRKLRENSLRGAPGL